MGGWEWVMVMVMMLMKLTCGPCLLASCGALHLGAVWQS